MSAMCHSRRSFRSAFQTGSIERRGSSAVGARRKAVFFQNAVGLPSSPVAVLACVPILADGVAVRRTDSARCKGGVGQGAGRRCMRIGRWFSSAACVATLTRAFELVREPVYPASGSNLAQGAGNRLGRQVFNADEVAMADPKRRPFRNRPNMRYSRKEAAGEKEADGAHSHADDMQAGKRGRASRRAGPPGKGQSS
jgi:hypothetical protein